MSDDKPDTGGDLRVQVGILGERVSGIEKNLGGQIGGLSQQLAAALGEIRASYATASSVEVVKSDVAGLGKRVDVIASSLGWGVKIVIGAVIMAVLGLVFVKGGVAHP